MIQATLSPFEWWKIFLGGVSTLAIFSFLIKENPLYRLFEHIFIGTAAALGIMATVKYFILPEVVIPLLGLDIVTFADGSTSGTYDRNNLLLLIPMGFGSLYYCILTKRFNWLAQIVIGFSLGLGGGLAFKGILAELIPQLTNSFRPLYVPGDSFESLSNGVFIFTLLSVMSYFFFTFRSQEGALGAVSSKAGRWLMMGCFGSFFGATIMARMALLVERLEFLIQKWFPLFYV